MDVDENYDVEEPGSNQDISEKWSPKLRDKINQLAKWQIDPGSIKFPEATSKFHGGHATVSRANLAFENGSDLGESLKVVAVKSISIDNETDRERVLGLALREAAFLANLSHENIIKFEGFAQNMSKDRIWLIFPWEENGTLKAFAASKDWEIPERISLIYDTTRGVEYLHGQSPPIYHGDLKSANILVTSGCRAVITDFGSARRLTKKDPGPPTENKGQPLLQFQATFCESTNTMTLTGNEYTLRWAAPELLMDEQPGLSSDIWSLGWIFYEVMTNFIPFENVRKESVVIKHVIQGNLPSVTNHARMSLIRRLCSLMIECWHVDPGKRPAVEYCRKSLEWMPMVVPDLQGTADTGVSRVRSAQLLVQLGVMHGIQDDYINAASLFTEALTLYTNVGDRQGRINALSGLAAVYRAQHAYDKALNYYSEAAHISGDIGDKHGTAHVLLGIAAVHRAQNEYNQAVAFYSEALQICTETDQRLGRAEALLGLAEVHRLQEEYSEAIELFSEALKTSTDIGDRQEQLQRGYSALLAVPSICTDIGQRLAKVEALSGLASVHRLHNDYNRAAALYSEALQIQIDVGDGLGRAKALSGLAEVHRDQGHHNDAISLYKQAAEIYEQIGSTKLAAEVLDSAALLR